MFHQTEHRKLIHVYQALKNVKNIQIVDHIVTVESTVKQDTVEELKKLASLLTA